MKIKEINDKKCFAILQLKQVANINICFFLSRDFLCERLKSISNALNEVVAPYNTVLNLENFKLKKCDVPDLFTKDGFGHFYNKMVIVYSASILENFLFEVGRLLYIGKSDKKNLLSLIKRFYKGIGNKDVGFARSFCRLLNDFCRLLNEQNMKEESLPVSFGRLSVKFKEKNIKLTDIDGYKQCKLLTDIRHKIVHTQGIVDDNFVNNINKNDCPEANILKTLNTGDQIHIPIDTVILPCLSKSIDFLNEFYNKIKAIYHP